MTLTQHADRLETFAQVFAAFVVFAGIGLRVAAKPASVARNTLRFILAIGLLALAAAVMPLLAATHLDTSAVSRLSASFLASGAIAVGYWVQQRTRPPAPTLRIGARIAGFVAYTVSAAFVIALFAVGAGLIQRLASLIYLGALAACITLCALGCLKLTLTTAFRENR